MHPTFKRLFSLFSVLALTCIFSACEQKTPSTSPSSPTTRLLLDWLPNPNHVPLYVGIEKGFFEKQGIYLTVLKLHDPGDTIPYLTSGLTDLAIYYMPSALKAMSKGAEFKVIGALIKEPLDCLLFRADSGIKTYKDLNEKVIGYPLNGLGTTYVNSLIQKDGIHLKSTRRIGFNLATALGCRHVDAAFGAYWNIESELLRVMNVETLYFKLSEFDIPTYHELIVIANEPFLSQNPSLAARFRGALEESIAFCKEHPQEAFGLYLQANPDKDQFTSRWEAKAWLHTYPILANNQNLDSDCWQTFYEWMRHNGLINHDLTIEGLLQ